MSLRRAGQVVARVVVVAAGTVAVGVAINQVLNGGEWNWWALGVAATIAVAAEAVNQWLARRDVIRSEPQPSAQVPVPLESRSVNVSGSVSGVIATGDGATIIQGVQPPVLRPPAQVEAAPGLVHLPAASGVFVGRGDELARLEAALSGSGQVVVAAVHGMGGIGKSTLVARYAADHADRFHPIWWITADASAALQAGLADLASALQSEAAAGQELEALAEQAVVWLASHTGWLLVLDNVADPADIAPLLARLRSGRVVVTSRLAQGWHRLDAWVLHVDVLDEAEAVDLLTRLARPRDSADWPGAADLVEELGHLPLAIDQAGAYLAQTRLTPAAYLALLTEQPQVMYDRAARGAPAERTIARIWRITLDSLSAASPLAADLLRILAWLAPEDVPRSLLEELTRPLLTIGAPRRRWRRRGRTADAAGWSPSRPFTDTANLTEALGLLAAYNMITLTQDTITVHRLVQAVARTPDAGDPHRLPEAVTAARDHATQLLRQTFPSTISDPADWPAWRALAPHLDALASRTTVATDTLTTASLLSGAAAFLENQGAVHRAIPYYERSLATIQRLCGPLDPETLAARTGLANAYRTVGSLERAIPLLEQNLSDSLRVLGEDHPDTLACRSDLAYARESAGDLDQAVSLYEQTLAVCLRVLGEDHPDTLASRNNLALTCKNAGDLNRAISLYEQTLADRLRVLGDGHPDVMVSRNNLASAYQDAGDLDRALPLYEQALADSLHLLGEDHPDTLACRSNLALAYEKAGRPDQAISLLEQILTDSLQVLGHDHPSTLAYRNNLAYAHESMGNLDQAISLYEQNLSDSLRLLGEDHPETLASRNNLASAYREAGDPDRAIFLHEQTLADRLRILGEDHPDTLASRNNLASAYQDAGDLNRALPLYEQNLDACMRLLGEDHPETLTYRGNLAYAYWAAEDLDKALPLLEQNLADRLRILGEDHPDTLTSCNNLAAAHESMGNLDQAISLYEQTLATCIRVLGEDHPLTRTVRENLEDAKQE
ncbi:FxSxx-COOH system tetratricopeptide repeat protein [Actinocorallia populi]|uniref:FxSxx-COOH system tetratricopeptide repeat protein n=1 Tax=Actinocorallia populi TaxID=2079200 RepID=UPI0018E557EC|nr:FxSxx-COOH system tetratricopeptide repeat protein [Actinocorallia populi]